MRIAFLPNPPSGRGKAALYDPIRGLTGRGHVVETWCPPSADLSYLPLGGMAVEHVVNMDWPLKPRLTDLSHWAVATRRTLEAMDTHCRQCAAEIAQGGFDVLFANRCYLFATTSIGRFVKSIPSVLYLQEPCRYLYEASPRLKWVALPPSSRSWFDPKYWSPIFKDWRDMRNYRLQARAEVDNAAEFTRILVNSYFSRESILRAYGLQSDVCYLGVDSEHFTDRHLPREDYVVGLGSITPNKNIGLVIEAISQIPAPRPQLVWVGNFVDQAYHGEMTALAAARQVELTIKVRVSDDELLDTLNRASTMVYAPYLEPFGLAPLEASACAVPVIAVAEGGVRETILDRVTGLQVASDATAIADAIQRLRADPAFARKLGASGRAGVEEAWSFEAATDRIERHLQRYALRT